MGASDQQSRPIRAARRARPWRRVFQWLMLLFAAVLVVDAVMGEKGVIAMWRAGQQYTALARSVTTLRQENQALAEQARRLREDPRAIEELARRELGLMRPGEVVFIIKDAPSTAGSPR